MRTSTSVPRSPTGSPKPLGRPAAVALLLGVLGIVCSPIASGPADAQGPPADQNQSMEDYYRSRSGGGGDARGGSPASRGTTPPASGGDAVTAELQRVGRDLMRDLPLQALTGPPPRSLPTGVPQALRDAQLAMQSGLMDVALNLWAGQIAIDPESMSGALSNIGYCRALRQPIAMIRFGSALNVRNEEGLDPQPVTESSHHRQSMTSRGGGGGGGSDRGMQAAMQEQEMRRQLAMQQQMAGGQGSFGRGREGFGLSSPASLAPVVPDALDLNPIDPAADEVMRDTIGLVAERFAENFNRRLREGQFGKALLSTLSKPLAISDDTTADASAQTDQTTSSTDATRPIDDASPRLLSLVQSLNLTPSMWLPTLEHLGQIDASASIAAAKQRGIDFVFQFDVTIKEESASSRGGAGGASRGGYGGRSAPTDNITRIRVYDVRSGRSLYSTRSISSAAIRKELARRGSVSTAGLIDAECEQFWSNFDRAIQVVDMPTIDAAAAVRRVGQLLSAPTRAVLQSLAEVRLYGHRGYLQPDQVDTAFAILAGDDGLKLLHGTSDFKRNTLYKLAAPEVAPSN